MSATVSMHSRLTCQNKDNERDYGAPLFDFVGVKVGPLWLRRRTWGKHVATATRKPSAHCELILAEGKKKERVVVCRYVCTTKLFWWARWTGEKRLSGAGTLG